MASSANSPSRTRPAHAEQIAGPHTSPRCNSRQGTSHRMPFQHYRAFLATLDLAFAVILASVACVAFLALPAVLALGKPGPCFRRQHWRHSPPHRAAASSSPPQTQPTRSYGQDRTANSRIHLDGTSPVASTALFLAFLAFLAAIALFWHHRHCALYFVTHFWQPSLCPSISGNHRFVSAFLAAIALFWHYRHCALFFVTHFWQPSLCSSISGNHRFVLAFLAAIALFWHHRQLIGIVLRALRQPTVHRSNVYCTLPTRSQRRDWPPITIIIMVMCHRHLGHGRHTLRR